MKLKSVLGMGVVAFALALTACGQGGNNSGGNSAPAGNTPNGGTNTPQRSCTNLAGSKFVGAQGQGGSPTEGCEGCGNPGSIDFESATEATLAMPGDDVLQQCTYAVSGARLQLSCDGSSKSFEVSADCNRLSSGRLTFSRR